MPIKWGKEKMTDKKEYPEHIRQCADLVSAVLRRIKNKQSDKTDAQRLHLAGKKVVATA